MKSNEEEKSLAKVQNTFWNKIKKFLNSLFNKKEIHTGIIEEQKDNHNFKENLQIKKDEEKERIVYLQKEYKEGNIDEYDLTEDEYSKLIKLYEEQNKKLREEIELCKKETANILCQMKSE